mgnify:FL=1
MNFTDIPIVDEDQYSITDSVKLNSSPGTGKTTQSFRRYIEALDELGIGVEDTCVVSYRVSLADDLINRLNHLGIVDDVDSSDIDKFGTIHAVAKRLLGVSHKSMVDSSDRQEWCTSRGWTYYSDDNESTIGELFFDILDWLAINNKTVNDASVAPAYEEFVGEFREVDLSNIIKSWNDYKVHHGLYDYHDLLGEVVHQDIIPDVEILVVDEMHDVYPLMFSVIELWVNKVKEQGGTVIVAGDTQQVINRYQGAHERFFNNLDIPEITLKESFVRPPESHWNLATDVLSKSQTPRDIKVNATGNIDYKTSPNLPSVEPNSPQDILYSQSGEDDTVMYLARSRAQCRQVSKSLKKEGILFNGSSGTLAWSRRHNPKRVALYHVLKILSIYGDKDGKIFAETSKIEFDADDALYFIKELPSRYVFGDKSEFEFLAKSENEVRLKDFIEFTTEQFWDDLTNNAESVNKLLVKDGIKSWLKPALENNSRTLDEAEQLDITVQTIHASKGSEADVVVLYDGITSRIRDAMYTDEGARANEHRVWYVALTRSKRDLVIVNDAFDYTIPFLGGDVL